MSGDALVAWQKRPLLSLIPLLALLVTAVLWISLEQWLLGALPAIIFAVSLIWEAPVRRWRYLALASSVLVLSIAPVNTDLSNRHFLVLSSCFALAIALPTALLWRERPRVITYKFWPDKLDKIDIIYTIIAIPLAWGVFILYFQVLSPEVPFNWSQPPEPDNNQLFRLFMGINAVGIWDELFFINVSYAIIRSLFPYRIANCGQAVIYTCTLWDMAFKGVGPVIVGIFALTQGAMYERAKALLWVLIVHLIVDYFLFQAIISAHYPQLDVWWH